ncbi:MAG: STAS domain-containing protein [Clostridia bacterium]|nr:STAS domain-containing protein [Clostridia bacterium]
MTITQNFNDGQWNIAIEGRLDANTSPELEETLKAEPQGLTGLTLDFGELNYISSAGLRVMLLALKQMNMAGKPIKVVNVTDPVFEVLELTGFVDILDIERA